MTREIKFRGKNRKGEWLVGEIISLNNHKYIAPEDGDWFDFIPWDPNNVFHAPDSYEYEVDQETIGQFTGLQDKKGKEIYEGDIVKTLVSPLNATKNKRYRNFAIRYNAPQFWNGYDTILMRPQHMEIIGNIHDNPELLNKYERLWKNKNV